jgi:hypothetical protein
MGVQSDVDIHGLRPKSDGKSLKYRKRRKLWNLKEFYVETFWHYGHNARGIELHHKESGRCEMLIGKGTRRELWQYARLVAAKLKDPDLQKRIDRLEGKERPDSLEEILARQQQVIQQHAARISGLSVSAAKMQQAQLQSHIHDSLVYGMGVSLVGGGATKKQEPSKPRTFQQIRDYILGKFEGDK